MIVLCEECGITHSTYLEATKRVRELHNNSGSEYCHECGYTYPCDTIKALDGDD